MPNPWLIIGVMVAIAGSWLAGWKMAMDHEKAKALEGFVQEAKRGNEIAAKTEQNLANLRIEHKTIIRNAEKEIHHEKVYSDCKPTPDGIRLWNDASEKPTTGKPSDSMPEPAKATQ